MTPDTVRRFGGAPAADDYRQALDAGWLDNETSVYELERIADVVAAADQLGRPVEDHPDAAAELCEWLRDVLDDAEDGACCRDSLPDDLLDDMRDAFELARQVERDVDRLQELLGAVRAQLDVTYRPRRWWVAWDQTDYGRAATLAAAIGTRLNARTAPADCW